MNTTDGPLISIVIPTYNHAHFLGRALQSVLDQTYPNWEVILVDNHSQDNTEELVEGLNEPRIRLLKIHNNGVIAASRNMGVRAARGEWVAFLDSDDLWYPSKLAIALQGIQGDCLTDVCSTNEMLVDEITGERRLLKFGPYCSDFYQRLLLRGNCLSPSASVVKRKFLTDNNILFRENKEFVTAEDYDMWMLLAQAGARFKFINSVQGEYRIHATNSSGQIERHRQAVINVVKDQVFKVQTFDTNREGLWRKIYARLLLESANNRFVKSQFMEGLHDVFQAFNTSFWGSLGHIYAKASKR